MQGDDHYYENVGGKRFVEKSRQVFPRTSWGAMGIKFFDFDNDGRLDIFITDMHSDMSDDDRSGTREAEVDHEVAGVVPRQRQRRASGATRSSMKDGPGKFHEVSDALGVGELLAVGAERRRPQRRRLRRRLHRVRHELSRTAT